VRTNRVSHITFTQLRKNAIQTSTLPTTIVGMYCTSPISLMPFPPVSGEMQLEPGGEISPSEAT